MPAVSLRRAASFLIGQISPEFVCTAAAPHPPARPPLSRSFLSAPFRRHGISVSLKYLQRQRNRNFGGYEEKESSRTVSFLGRPESSVSRSRSRSRSLRLLVRRAERRGNTRRERGRFALIIIVRGSKKFSSTWTCADRARRRCELQHCGFRRGSDSFLIGPTPRTITSRGSFEISTCVSWFRSTKIDPRRRV